MTDFHIHVGQFHERYYDPALVLETVFQAGVEELVFSSTTSCKADVRYTQVEKELARALKNCPAGRARPLFWYIPSYKRQGVSVETAMTGLSYSGFKLHPRAQLWDMTNSAHLDALHGLFDFADRGALPVLIHTGPDKMDEAALFSAFFGHYPRARFILSHARPLDQALSLMTEHPNVYCDTAFVSLGSIRRITACGLAAKIVPGSDFPITHYFRAAVDAAGKRCSLKEQYGKDVTHLRLYTSSGISAGAGTSPCPLALT
jgi:predicted TIM-barrel fold metal-dependent hydrolase